MDSTLWDKLSDYFDQALEMSASEQQVFLKEIKASDESIWEELVSLLQFSESADSYLGDVKGLMPGVDEDKPPEEVNLDLHELIGSRIKQYEILDALGVGGMGVVYKGRDVELQRTVALKFLPPELVEDKDARNRFYVEARAASKLDHPHVCTIHEIGTTEEGQIFIVMGYYEGETLLDMLERGELPLEKILTYIRQIALGLQAAHQNEIVHRDIKPGNVMITPDGVVKILDFGLAKIADQKLTRTGMTMGTVAYMSPELIRGGTPSPASDIWSLGVLMYELVTQLRPFRGFQYEGVMYSVVHNEPNYEEELPLYLPGYVKHIITRCLQKDPDHRYTSAYALIQDLDGHTRGNGAEEVGDERQSRSLSTKQLVAIGCGVLVLLAFLLSTTRTSVTNGGRSATEQRVAIMPFTSVPEQDEANQILTEGLMYSLASTMLYLDSPEHPVDIIPVSTVRRYGVKDAQDARKILDVSIAVEGALSRQGNVVNLSLNLIEAKNIRVLGGDMRQIEIDDSFNPLSPGFQQDILSRIAEILNIPLDDTKRAILAGQIPQNPEAYALYLQGVGYLQRFDKPGYYDYAIELFQEAIQIDARSPLAHAGLCEALWEKYENTDDSNYADLALSSCDRSAELGSEQVPVLISLSSVYQRTGEFDRAEQLLRRALEREPENAEAYRWLGKLAFYRIELDSARVHYERAISLRKNNWIYYNELGVLLNEHGLHEEAAQQHARAQELTPDSYYPLYQLGVTQRSLGNIEEAESLFLRAIEMNPEDPLVNRSLGILYYRERRFEEANTILGNPTQAGDLMSLSFLASANFWLGNQAFADSTWNALTEHARAALAVAPMNRVARSVLIDALSAQGYTDEAMDALSLFSDSERAYPWVAYFASRTYERSGDRTNALSSIERALQQHFDVYMFENDPWLLELRADRSYSALREEYLTD